MVLSSNFLTRARSGYLFDTNISLSIVSCVGIGHPSHTCVDKLAEGSPVGSMTEVLRTFAGLDAEEDL